MLLSENLPEKYTNNQKTPIVGAAHREGDDETQETGGYGDVDR